MADLFDAIEFAARAHHGQFRKRSPIPYIVHPLSVMRILIECGAADEVVIAGVLHDVVEDTSVTLDEVRGAFGENVASLVQGMSEPDRQAAWEIRKRDMLVYFESAPQDVLLIELADKLDNIREIQKDLDQNGEAVWARFNRGRERQQWLYLEYAVLFERRAESECAVRLAGEFRRRVNEVFGVSEASVDTAALSR